MKLSIKLAMLVANAAFGSIESGSAQQTPKSKGATHAQTTAAPPPAASRQPAGQCSSGRKKQARYTPQPVPR
jgi:hypothetical protein